ncbi:MAG: hypothetical protein Q4F69_08315 [Bacteroidia bacterium]|nr:hypothetical protein [Bacteroidia bacterium]
MKKTIPFIIIALFLFSCGNKSNGDKKGRKKIEHQYYCEICIDTLDVIEGKVQKNDILSKIL